MKVGVEIIAETAVQIYPHSCFKIDLTGNHQLIQGFSGFDKYAFSGFVLRNKRVAASGRVAEYGFRGTLFGLGSWEAEEAKVAVIPELLSARFRLLLSTDLIPDRDSFIASFGLRLIAAGRRILLDIPLCCPVLEVMETAPGRYSVELTELLRERLEK